MKLHYLRWLPFDDDTRFMYQGIFDTDFDKYTDDAIELFKKAGVDTVFENLEGFPEDWKTNPDAFMKFVRRAPGPELHGVWRVPHVSSDEIKKGAGAESRLFRHARADPVARARPPIISVRMR